MKNINCLILILFTTLILSSCRKEQCGTSSKDVDFYQRVSPETKEFKIGDTMRWHFYAPFNNTDNFTNQAVNISNTKKIHKFSISLVRIDSSQSPGVLIGGLTHFELSFLKGRNPTFFKEIPYNDNRVDISLEKGNDQFEVIVQAVAVKRGVFMLSHYITSGVDCMLIDFIPKLFNKTRNEELFTQFAIYNTPVTFYGTEYFFRVK